MARPNADFTFSQTDNTGIVGPDRPGLSLVQDSVLDPHHVLLGDLFHPPRQDSGPAGPGVSCLLSLVWFLQQAWCLFQLLLALNRALLPREALTNSLSACIYIQMEAV